MISFLILRQNISWNEATSTELLDMRPFFKKQTLAPIQQCCFFFETNQHYSRNTHCSLLITSIFRISLHEDISNVAIFRLHRFPVVTLDCFVQFEVKYEANVIAFSSSSFDVLVFFFGAISTVMLMCFNEKAALLFRCQIYLFKEWARV